MKRPFVPPLAVGDRVEINAGGYGRVVEIVSDRQVRVQDTSGRLRYFWAWQVFYCPEPQVIAAGIKRIQRSWHNDWLRRKLGLSPMQRERVHAG